MNVLMVVPWDNRGGVCAVVNHVASHLKAHGHCVTYLLPGPSTHPTGLTSREGFPAYAMNMRPPSVPHAPVRSRIAYLLTLPRTVALLASLVRRLQIDVVNIHFPAAQDADFAILRWLGLVKVVTSIHGADVLPNGGRVPVGQRAIRALLGASDAVVTPSDSYARAVRDAWPELRQLPMSTIPNGIDADELGFRPDSDDTNTATPFVLSILQLIHYKGVDVLIRAFAALSADFPDYRLKLVSGGPDRAQLEALAVSLDVAGRVDFLGNVDRVRVGNHLRACTLFVLPSRTNSESFGIAVAEAMAVDRAVIASRAGALPELIDDGETGLLVPPGDVGALEAAMRTALGDVGLRQRLGRNAGRRVRRDLPWSNTGTMYEHLFEGVVEMNEKEQS